MATLSKGKTFTNGETVTPQKLHELVDLGTVSGIVNADIAASAAIADSKLAQITTAGKVLPAAVQGTAVVTADPRLSDARMPVPHGHAISDTTGLQTALDGKATFSHTHSIANVTGLQTALDGKQAAGSYAPATGITPSAITGTAVITTDSRLSDARTPSDGSVTNAKISSTAAIADSKLATISTAGKVSNSATTATNANTANAIVARDTNGNFSAGTITAALSGNAATATTAASCSGNAATATTAASLQTARTINGVSFNGTADITVTANPNAHTHDDRYYTETEVTALLSDKQKINGQTISAGLNWDGNKGIQFSNIPSGVQKFTLLVEIWVHDYSSLPGRGVVNIGTTTSGLITWNSSGVIANPYYAAVNNAENSAGFEITGGANTSASHVGVFNFYVTNNPFSPTTQKRLICESHVTQKSGGAITILQGTGYIDYTGEINEFVLRPVYNSNAVASAAARLYFYY